MPQFFYEIISGGFLLIRLSKRTRRFEIPLRSNEVARNHEVISRMEKGTDLVCRRIQLYKVIKDKLFDNPDIYDRIYLSGFIRKISGHS